MIARKSALIIFIQLLNGILGYIGLKYIALYMEPWEYGVVGFAYGFIALFSIFGKLGFDQAHIKRISEGKKFGTCVGTFVISKAFLAGLMATFVIMSIAIWKYVIGRGFETSLHEQAVYIMLAYFVLLTLTHSMISTFNAKKEIAKAQLPLLLYTIVRVASTIVIAYNGLGVLALAYSYIIGEIFHFGLALFFFRKYSVGKPTFGCLKSYSKFALPMAIVSASVIIMTNIDKVFIQLFWSAQQVGEYFAVFNLSRYTILFVSSVGLLLFPTISKHHLEKNMGEIKKLVLKSERYMSMIVFPIVFLMVMLAEPIIHILLSDSYMPALPVLQILPFFVLMEAFSRPYISKFKGMDMPHITRNRVIIMVFFNIFLNLILIPKDIQIIDIKCAGLGSTGAAIATVCSYFIGLIYARIMTWKLTKIKGNIRIILHALSAGSMATILYVLLYYFNMCETITRWYHLLGFTFLGFGIYLGFLYLMREFTKEDFHFFVDTLNIKKMFKYIYKEVKGR